MVRAAALIGDADRGVKPLLQPGAKKRRAN
jgi:hypothetical protein